MRIGKYRVYLKNHDLPALLMMYGWATWYYFSAGRLGHRETNMAFIQPMYFIMLALGVIYLLKAVTIERPDGSEGAADTMSLTVRFRRWYEANGRLSGFLALLVIYLFVMEKIGFFVSTASYLATATIWLGNRNKWQIFLVPVLATAAVYFIFTNFFYVKLPSGILF